jgi:DNA (cytosine-5)-methyltransferase 1
MTVGSLFSGVGGFDIGLERAGYEIVWQCEADPKCQSVLRRHWPDVRLIDDVERMPSDAEPVDLVCGGFPCTDVSLAGRRAGLAGEQSGLWFAMLRTLRALRPRWVVIENVPGLLSSNGGRDFGAILTGLVKLGYGVCWRVLNSADFGVAQRRRRVFIVGHLGDGRGAEVFPLGDGVRWDIEEGAEPGAEPDGGVGAGARDGGELVAFYTNGADRGLSVTEDRTPPLKGAGGHGGQTVGVAYGFNPQEGTGFECPVEEKSNALAVTKRAGVYVETGAGRWKDDTAVGTLRVHRSGREANLVPEKSKAVRHMGCGVKGADHETLIPTIYHERSESLTPHDKSHNAQVVHDSGVRRLTPTECCRLQGFPDDWNAVGSNGEVIADTHRYRQMGNAVTVNVVEWIGRRILMVEAAA